MDRSLKLAPTFMLKLLVNLVYFVLLHFLSLVINLNYTGVTYIDMEGEKYFYKYIGFTSENSLQSDFPFFPCQGHAAPILYAAWAEAGLFPVSELDNLRKIDSDLEGHPTPVSFWI